MALRLVYRPLRPARLTISSLVLRRAADTATASLKTARFPAAIAGAVALFAQLRHIPVARDGGAATFAGYNLAQARNT